jgi:hypothetical protein
MPNSKKDIQTRIENLLQDNPSKSYSSVEKILGEIEVWSSMKDNQSSIYSSCKDGTVYFQWGDTP